jgi:DnaJ-domain-containing protein 1
VDQIFDRLEKLVQAWMSSVLGRDSEYTYSQHQGFFRERDLFREQDFADAWEELESYLDPSKIEFERHTNARRHRSSDEDDTRRAVEDAYRFLGLEPYTPFPLVKARYKELLKKHHPDRHTDSPENLKEATAISTKINTAYQLIETWEESRAANKK